MRYNSLLLGAVIGILLYGVFMLAGFEVERTSYLQLYEINHAASPICNGICRSIEGPNADCELTEPTRALLEKYRIDDAGSGWPIRMPTNISAGDDWMFDESSLFVYMLFWRNQPFGVLAANPLGFSFVRR